MKLQGFLAILFAIASVFSCAGAQAKLPAIKASATPISYVELLSYWSSDQQYDAWFDLQDRAKQDFDEICGDTFCEGDYSNIQSLSLTCSARSVDGLLGQCVWNFAGSNEDVDPQSGRIVSQFAHWACPSPIVAGTTAEQLVQALSVAHPLYQALPGTDRSLYDGLTECL